MENKFDVFGVTVVAGARRNGLFDATGRQGTIEVIEVVHLRSISVSSNINELFHCLPFSMPISFRIGLVWFCGIRESHDPQISVNYSTK